MLRRSSCIVLLAVLPALAACTTAPATPTMEPLTTALARVTARVDYAVAPAWACSRTTGCAVAAGQVGFVFAGGEARTGAGGLVTLETPTTVFRVDANATLQFREVNDSLTRLVLAAGRLFVQHSPAGRDQIVVEAGTVRVEALDTRFSVMSDTMGVSMVVPPGGGSVQVLAFGQEETVPAATGITIAPGATTLPVPSPIEADEQTAWDQVLREWQQHGIAVTPRLPAATPSP